MEGDHRLATAIPARLSPKEGRKFGLTVGGAFAVLALLLWWRGRAAAPVLGAVAGLLVVAALAIPTSLGPVQRAWMGLAHAISKVTTPIFMGVVYFGVLTPISMLMRAFGKNPLTVRPQAGGFWVPRPGARSSMERQF